jgi:hypothetical protein
LTTTTVPSPIGDRIAAFRGLGTWVDTLDYPSLRPAVAIADMRARHVRTLYLATARYDSPSDILDPAQVNAWLDGAHAAGIRVVGWYVPDLRDVARDIRRTVAVAGYRTTTDQRFDAVAVDIEYPAQVADAPGWNAAVAQLLTGVRARTSLPLGAITLPPVLMSGWPDPTRWAGFPWATIGRVADVVLPMDYWTSYTAARLCPTQPRYCVADYTATNVARTRQLTGRPVHIIGGVGDAATAGEVSTFVSTAQPSGVIGGSLYDYRTTTPPDWSSVRAFG